MQLLFSFDQIMVKDFTFKLTAYKPAMKVDETHVNSPLSTLVQLLFSFDQAMKVDETLMQTLGCHLSFNSCSCLIKQLKLMKLSCKLSLVNSHATIVLL